MLQKVHKISFPVSFFKVFLFFTPTGALLLWITLSHVSYFKISANVLRDVLVIYAVHILLAGFIFTRNEAKNFNEFSTFFFFLFSFLLKNFSMLKVFFMLPNLDFQQGQQQRKKNALWIKIKAKIKIFNSKEFFLKDQKSEWI